MIVGLDTTAVVRLLVRAPVEQAEAAERLLAGGDVVVSDLVVAESYHALRHHYMVPHAEAAGALARLLGDRRIRPTGVAPEVLATARGAGPGFMDRLIHADYGLAAAALHTFDRSAARLPGARLIE